MTKKLLLLILFLFVLGIILRIYKLGSLPTGFFRDEAALGYNAFSILKTGNDEFGMPHPLVFRSFEVFFLPAYVYFSIPLIWSLGLTEFSVRLLSSISGIFSLIIIFLIAKRNWDIKVAVSSLLLLVIAPWHIFYSRGSFEGNLALALFYLGFFLWLEFVRIRKLFYFFPAILSFTASMYSYQSERVIVPLFAIFALIVSFKYIWSLRLKLIIPSLIVFVILLPLLSLSFIAGGYHRAFGVSIFTQEVNPPGYTSNQPETLFTNNKVILRTKEVLSLYFSYFSPKNLFTEGDYNRQRSSEDYSVFYAWYFPLILSGLILIIKRKKVADKLLLCVIVLAPIPAALTGDPFHTYRSLLLYFPLTLIAGVGLSNVYHSVGKYKLRELYKPLFVLLVSVLSVVSLMYFLFSYILLTPSTRARDWDYGYKEMVDFLNTLPVGTPVFVDDPLTAPYINFLFFAKVDPLIYQTEVAKLGTLTDYYYQNGDKIRPDKFADYTFTDLDWSSVRGEAGSVFVFTSRELPETEFKNDPKVKLLKEISYPDGTVAYRIVQIIQ